jgi:hypothetical protein
MTIQETVESGVERLQETVRVDESETQQDLDVLLKGFLETYTVEILQSVMDGLPPVLGINLQYKAGNNHAVEFMHSQLKKAIADLSGKEQNT